MKRQSNDQQSLVYAYGVGRIESGLEHALAEQARNWALWDTLVDIDGAHDISILAAASVDDDRLVFLRDEIYFAGRALSEAIEARAAERKRVKKNEVAQSLEDALTVSSVRLKPARKEFYARLSAWKKANPEAMREFTLRRFASIKDARNASGLYWPNYNRVIQSFDAARQLCRKTGRRLRYSDEERTDGCLTVQIQRTTSGLGAAPLELQDGSYAPLQINMIPAAAYDPATPRGERSRLCQSTVQMRIDSEGHMLTARVWMHRPMPADCRIKSAQLTWRDGGARGRKWQLAFTISRSTPVVGHIAPDAAVGIDVGWRVMEDGSLRVAVCANSEGKIEELRLPAMWMDHQDWIERLRSDIDGQVIVGASAVRRAELRIKGGRSKDIGERREIYRLFAGRIAMTCGIVAVEDIDLSRLAHKGANPEFAGRANRQRACIHQLLGEIKHQCSKHGSRLILMAGPSTMQCHECGKLSDPPDRSALLWTCDGCGSVWDQDVNAARNLLAAAVLDASAKVMQGGSRKENKVLPAQPRRPRGGARNPVRQAAQNTVLL